MIDIVDRLNELDRSTRRSGGGKSNLGKAAAAAATEITRLRDALAESERAVAGLIERLERAERRVKALEEQRERLEQTLTWYGEQARLARLIHSEGDLGRRNLATDGGGRARAALEGSNR